MDHKASEFDDARLASVYDPGQVEDRWYRYWEQGRFFTARVTPDRPAFAVVIPPPNVTGKLHLGHALNTTVQDVLVRWKRMRGYSSLWMPGTDHAGIATQHVVEKLLAEEGLSRYDLGRESFLDKVWEWKDTYERNIINQLKKMGASCDWDRTRFTMDAGCSRAVREVFVTLYERGLIYQDDYIINWCPDCHTALSDIEVEHQETAGRLYHVRYPLKDGGGQVVVATTRPETILGDTAVAVHPDDGRYTDLLGKTIILPVIGREIPVIADSFVDPEFGTGAVKVTPAHDPADFEAGNRHGLERIQVIDDDGRMTALAGKYHGLDRYECRRRLLADLEQGGYLVKVEDHAHAVGHCYRCDTVVEPLVSRQWFVRMQPLARPAEDVVREGRVRFVPARFEKIYLNWLGEVRDWCISRQIWWGHRIPAWYCRQCGETVVTRVDPTACPRCGSDQLEQDPDVLDTWFSSALWPFSTMGWPDATPELGYFFPTDVLVTAYDIIFFWVARMVFSSLEFMGDIPFRDVLITGLIRDAQGRKMSKSLGNGIDPLEVIERYGADTLRFTLVTGNAPGNDMRFSWEKVEGSRNFCNKLWNAARFALLHMDDFDPAAGEPCLELADRWILSRVRRVAGEVDRHLERYDLGEAARELHQFIWGELCDWYIELVKPRLYGEGKEARYAVQHTLWRAFDTALRLLHPFMPFITEEIWQHLPHDGDSLMVMPWPARRAVAGLEDTEPAADPRAEEQMEVIIEVTRSIRSLRAEVGVDAGKRGWVLLEAGSQLAREALETGRAYILELGRVEELHLIAAGADVPRRALTNVVKGVKITMPLEGLVDLDRERERLQKELAGARAELERSQRKLANHGFVSQAPPQVVDRERERNGELAIAVKKLEERLAQLE